jgi:hypothetical protein
MRIAHARLLVFTLFVSINLALSVGLSGCLPTPGVFHAPTARQEEVSPVQCACAPFFLFCTHLAIHYLTAVCLTLSV